MNLNITKTRVKMSDKYKDVITYQIITSTRTSKWKGLRTAYTREEADAMMLQICDENPDVKAELVEKTESYKVLEIRGEPI